LVKNACGNADERQSGREGLIIISFPPEMK